MAVIRNLSDYEAYLDEQDKHLFIEEDKIVCQFSRRYEIPLSRCTTLRGAIAEAERFALYLVTEEPEGNYLHLPVRLLYLIKSRRKTPRAFDPLDVFRPYNLRFLGEAAIFQPPEILADTIQTAFLSKERRILLGLKWEVSPTRDNIHVLDIVTCGENIYPEYTLSTTASTLHFFITRRVIVLALKPPVVWISHNSRMNSSEKSTLKNARLALLHSFSEDELIKILGQMRAAAPSGLRWSYEVVQYGEQVSPGKARSLESIPKISN